MDILVIQCFACTVPSFFAAPFIEITGFFAYHTDIAKTERLFDAINLLTLIPVAAWPNARVSGRSHAGIAGSIHPEGYGCLSVVIVVR
jgi:hypothetical protein